MLHVDDGQLHAYLDGELALLDAAGVAALERHLGSCAECRARLEEERAARERAHAILRGSGPVGFREPDFEALAARTPAPARPSSRRVRPSVALAWAASIVLALGFGWFGRELLLRSPELTVASETSPADAGSPPETRAAAPAEPESRPLAAVSRPQAEAPAPAAAPSPASPAARAPERPAARAAAREAPPAPAVLARVREDAPAEATMAEAEPGEPRPPPIAVARGRVVSEAGTGIPNVQVYLPSLDTGTLTRADGSYTLQVPAGRIPPSGELAIRAAVVGMRTETQQIVLKAGGEVAQNFELQPVAVALEEIVVTGTAGPTLERRVPATAAQATEPVAAAGEARWEPVERREAERRLGGRLRLVPGLRVIAITATAEHGAALVRTVQELEGGGWLELLQRREASGGEALALGRPARRNTESAAAPAFPAADLAVGDSLATIEIRREGYRITARAPLPAESLRVLLAQVQ